MNSTSSMPARRELKEDLEHYKVDHKVQIKAATSPDSDSDQNPKSVIVRRPKMSRAISATSVNAGTQTV